MIKQKIVKEKTIPYTLFGHGNQVFYHTEKVIQKSFLGFITWNIRKTETTHKNCKNRLCDGKN